MGNRRKELSSSRLVLHLPPLSQLELRRHGIDCPGNPADFIRAGVEDARRQVAIGHALCCPFDFRNATPGVTAHQECRSRRGHNGKGEEDEQHLKIVAR